MFRTQNVEQNVDFVLICSQKKFFLPEEDRWVTLNVSAAGIRTINKNGLSAALKDARKKVSFLTFKKRCTNGKEKQRQ